MECDEANFIRGLFFGLLAVIVTLLILITASGLSRPSTTFTIKANSNTYFSNSVNTIEGFVILNNYYEDNLIPPFHPYKETELKLQGKIEVISNK